MSRALSLVATRPAVQSIGRITAGAAFTAICAQISIPFEPVPVTLQTLAVTLCGLRLGAKEGTLSQLAYVAAGVAGLPVFASGKVGPAVLLGTTGGYLVAFVLAAGLLGWLSDRGLTQKWVPALGALLAANLLILGLGTAWLSTTVGVSSAIALGFFPFLVGAGIKSVAALGVMGLLPRR